METLIDDPPVSQGDWNKAQEDPKASSHRRRRRKEKAKSEGASSQPRKREKMETVIDDPPPVRQDSDHRTERPATEPVYPERGQGPDHRAKETAHHVRDQRTDQPSSPLSTDSAKQGRRRRKGESREDSSASLGRQGTKEEAPASSSTHGEETLAPRPPQSYQNSSAAHHGRPQTREDSPPASYRRSKVEKDPSPSHRRSKVEEDPPPSHRRSKVEEDPPPSHRRSKVEEVSSSPRPRKQKKDRSWTPQANPQKSGEDLSHAAPSRTEEISSTGPSYTTKEQTVVTDDTASRPRHKGDKEKESVEKAHFLKRAKEARQKQANVQDQLLTRAEDGGERTDESNLEQQQQQNSRQTEEKKMAKEIEAEKTVETSRQRLPETRKEKKVKRSSLPPPESQGLSSESGQRQSADIDQETGVQRSASPPHHPPQMTHVGNSSDPAQQESAEKKSAAAVATAGTEWSGEDLNPESHRLSDFKELCKSVASLLHIEDQEAAAMLTEPLSCRRDLIEGLDAEAIFDYLTQHGVLDNHTLQALRSSPVVTQRNAALLQHVEREGHNAVALFINALRQSGQLHLASSLDNTRRIQPVSEGDYFEKQRHKGEVTIVIKVHALLIVVPERDSEGDVIDDSMLASSIRGGLHQSYDNMLMMDDEPNVITDNTDDEDDHVKKRSFFCFCFPSRAAKKQKEKEKKYGEQHEMKPQGRSKQEISDGTHKERNGAWSSKSSAVSSPKHSRQQREPPDVLFSGDSRRNSGSPKKDWGVDHQGDPKSGVKELRETGNNSHNKENTDPVIMEYNKQMELIRLKAQKQRGDRARTTSQSSAIVMCEKWKYGGQYFRKKMTALCEQFEFDLQTYIIKYIEQDRGTLVLSVWTDQQSMYVSNICMTKQQVRQLHKDYTSGVLRERFDALLRTNQCLQKLDIRDMDLRIIIDDDQFQQALRELA